ncbi:glycerol kinase GlpK [Erysipelothrix urinaevulpis]|uniref:glycerol kinase GlpK n=1 Tax=Erysipelothrix urinaevulpis TaxID=2683717 RepID=UPI0013580757|nr:glycerol kinase GlpK [Erysipelothrix urinaevulpis]
MKEYIITLDQGTTSSRAIVFNRKQEIIGIAQTNLQSIYPQNAWVEQDPMEIWSSQSGALSEVIAKTGIHPSEIEAIGITNQRETTVVWNKETGKPIYNAIVWQCRRTASYCQTLVEKGLEPYIKENTGLVVDAYFSGTKIKWILDNVEGAKELASEGKLMFGTVDTWLLYNFSEKKVHKTDYTNASRTMIYNIKKLEWDEKLLNELEIPRSMLPEVCDSSSLFSYANIQGYQIPITAMVGDQQAALFGQQCFNKGQAKNTYGTGCFLLMNTKDELVKSERGLLSTIAIALDGTVEYALEGSVFIAGALIAWLKNEMAMLDSIDDAEYFATKVENNGGLYCVPAFTGLGAPHWDMDARGLFIGLTRSSNKNHFIRAALESIAYQSYDVMKSMEDDAQFAIQQLKVDGGAANNNFLMQFQADILNVKVERPANVESTSLGAYYLAGLHTSYFKNREEIMKTTQESKTWNPTMDETVRHETIQQWHKAVERSLKWKD